MQSLMQSLIILLGHFNLPSTFIVAVVNLIEDYETDLAALKKENERNKENAHYWELTNTNTVTTYERSLAEAKAETQERQAVVRGMHQKQYEFEKGLILSKFNNIPATLGMCYGEYLRVNNIPVNYKESGAFRKIELIKWVRNNYKLYFLGVDNTESFVSTPGLRAAKDAVEEFMTTETNWPHFLKGMYDELPK